MGAGDLILLADCGGGGNDTLALIVVIAVAALYLLAVGSVLRRAEDGAELMMLIGLLIVSGAIGWLAFTHFGSISGLGDFMARLVVSLLLSGGLALLAATPKGEETAGRAVMAAIAGGVFIPFGGVVVLVAAFGIGSACIS
jgi:hypothetical protein